MKPVTLEILRSELMFFQNEPQTDRSEKTEKSERDDKQLAPVSD